MKKATAITCAQSKPYPEMIELVARLKVQHGLKIAVVSNEGRELNAYRIRSILHTDYRSTCQTAGQTPVEE